MLRTLQMTLVEQKKYFITKITEKRGKMQARSLLMLISTLEMVRCQNALYVSMKI